MASGLPESVRRRGLLTYSSGNHGLAIALTARLLGVPAVIVMPTTAPAVKVEGARALGADVLFEGTTTIERKARAEAEAERRGLTIVPPFDHLQIAAGQGTIGLEILEQCPTVATVYVQMSGGGLISGVATALKRSRPSVCVVGVEPVGVARMTASLAAGHPVTIPITPGIADGLLAVRPGEVTFPHVQAFVDRVVTIDDGAIVDRDHPVHECLHVRERDLSRAHGQQAVRDARRDRDRHRVTGRQRSRHARHADRFDTD